MEPIIGRRGARWSTYAIAFLITALIFATAFYASNYFNNQRIADIRATQDDISTQILSLETQFDLLQEHSCANVAENTILPSEMTSLGNQLSYMEAQGGSSNEAEVVRLKGLYSILEIKDYLLMQQLAAKCNLKPVFILYFYSNKGDCAGCEKQGYALTSLTETYPELRVYSFDYNLNIGALQTMISIDGVHNSLPALLINGKAYYGYQSVEDIQKILPQLSTLTKSSTSTTATSTKK